jgi:hypothetical protein
MTRRSPPFWLNVALVVMTVQVILVAAGIVLTSRQPIPIAITPQMTGKPELCLTCHNGVEPISASHPMSEFGCVACHEGNGSVTNKDAAHANLVVNPASLDLAPQYCGTCHPAQVVMVQRSIMATYAGAINVVRHAFGAQADGQTQMTINGFGGLLPFAPAATDPQPIHDFANQCLTCHVSGQPTQADFYYRSTGCATCHVLYAEDGLYRGTDPTVRHDQAGHPIAHQFTTAIPYTQCNHCHNRGNYDLRTMSFIPRADMDAAQSLTGDAQRLHDYYQPFNEFTRCEYELDCIDCHTEQEVMGDGFVHDSRSQAAYVQCKTCHGTLDTLPTTDMIQFEQELAVLLARLNPNVNLSVGDTIMTTERGEPLYHIRQVDGQWQLTGKATGQMYDLPLVQGSQCQQNPDEQGSESCHNCHAANGDHP